MSHSTDRPDRSRDDDRQKAVLSKQSVSERISDGQSGTFPRSDSRKARAERATAAENRTRRHVTDETLFERWRRGDDSAFETLFERHNKCLLQTAEAKLQGRLRFKARDLVQNTWLKVDKTIGPFRDGLFGAWLRRVLSNEIKQLFRWQGGCQVRAFRMPLRLSALNDVVANISSPEARLEQLELRQAVRTGLSQLDDRERRCVEAVVIQGRPLSHVASAEGLGITRTRNLILRALQRLRATFQSHGYER